MRTTKLHYPTFDLFKITLFLLLLLSLSFISTVAFAKHSTMFLPCDNVTEGGLIGFTEIAAQPYTAATIQSLVDPSGGTGELEYMWIKTNNPELPLQEWMMIEGAEEAFLEPGTITETTYYLRCSRRIGCTEWFGESNTVAKILSPNDVECDAGVEAVEVIGHLATVSQNDGTEQAESSTGAIDGMYAALYEDGDSFIASLQDTLSEGQLITLSWKVKSYSTASNPQAMLRVYESFDGENFTLNTTLSTNVQHFGVHDNITLQSAAVYLKFEIVEGSAEVDFDAATYFKRTCVTNCSIGDRIWHDLNANGIQEDGEPGLAGVFIFLEDTLGNNIPGIDFSLSDADGNYGFDNLPCGYYVVRFATPAGFLLSPSDQGADDELDSDANNIDGRSPILNLALENNITNLDAGYYTPGSTIGRIWIDENGDGQESDSDTGVENVITQLYSTGADALPSTEDDTFIQEVSTDNLGYFEYFNLTPGDYYIKVDATTWPQGYEIVEPGQGSENFDSDLDPATAISPVFSIDSGENVSSSSDGGLKPICGIITDVIATDSACAFADLAFDAIVSEGQHTYLWEFFDDENGINKIGESQELTTSFMWENEGNKYYKLKITDTSGCAVNYAYPLTIRAYSDMQCDELMNMEISQFVVETAAEEAIQLRWMTQWSPVESYLDIQHSLDAVNFTSIGRLETLDAQDHHYEFTDQSPAAGRNFYRLARVAINGTIFYSEVVSLKLESAAEDVALVQPNPVTGQLTLRLLDSFAQEAQVKVITTTGAVLLQETISPGDSLWETNLEAYPNGIYYVQLTYDGFKKKLIRVVKKD